jgi:hypothetical protein
MTGTGRSPFGCSALVSIHQAPCWVSFGKQPALVNSPKGVIPSAAVLQAERGISRGLKFSSKPGLEQEISNSEFVRVQL